MHRRLGPDLRVALVTVALAAAGGFLWWRAPDLPQLTPHMWWPVLVALFALSERFVVHVPFGRDNNALSFIEVPLVLGLLFATSDELVLAGLAGMSITLVLLFRSPLIKIVFNLASWLFQAAAAVILFVALIEVFGAGDDPLSPAWWLAALVTTEVVHLISGLAVFTVISLRQGHAELRTLGRELAIGAVGTLVFTDLALITGLLLRRDPGALLLLGLMGVLTFALYRAFHVQRLRYGRLQLLYEFTSSVDKSLRDESVVETVQREAQALLRAGHADIVLCDDASLVTDPPPWWRPAADGTVLRLAKGRHGEAAPALRGTGHMDAMAAPLREEGHVVAVLVVTDRLDDMSTFDSEDARLFEALAGHASVALANSGLVERVRAAAAETEHLALHDPLTGLPNRLHFQTRLERRLLASGSAAVLLMDVDRFKEVNDTLGHDVGDKLLLEVGRRLRSLEHDETVVARLGGDEFAILLGDDVVHVEGMVQRVASDFRQPFRLGDLEVDVTASIGIAVAPRDGSSAALLLRRAEVAMYDAKQGLGGVARYSTERDPYSARRLSLISDLARALEEGSLDVHYQPQAEPGSGRVTGVEALLRWHHPVWGDVPPDEFVPLAEHTGLIRPLTRFVVETAVEQCVAWRDAGTPVQMAVNVSMRNLLEPELADVVARLLVRANLPAGLLKLEVTESAIVSDPKRAVSALERLVDLGLSVSVDDFGTGYSSLTRLRNLPVREVKIDRAFVRNITGSTADLAIVRAVISLGHDLGLRVVAEGVEDQGTWDVLTELGCDLVQGFMIAHPRSAEDLTGWLADHFATFATRLHHDQRREPRPGQLEDAPRAAIGSARGTAANRPRASEPDGR